MYSEGSLGIYTQGPFHNITLGTTVLSTYFPPQSHSGLIRSLYCHSTFNKQIFMKLGINIIPLENTQQSSFITYNQK